jgi:hypothetical protein
MKKRKLKPPEDFLLDRKFVGYQTEDSDIKILKLAQYRIDQILNGEYELLGFSLHHDSTIGTEKSILVRYGDKE